MSPVVMFEVGQTIVRLIEGNITVQDVDAIVDPANPKLMGGGIVDGALHRAGGTEILRECQKYRRHNGQLSPGEAIVTTAGDLDADILIHAVGPCWRGGDNNERAKLERVHINALMLARNEGVDTLALPLISTGGYRYPVPKASRVITETVGDFLTTHSGVFDELRFVIARKSKWDTFYSVAKMRYGERIA